MIINKNATILYHKDIHCILVRILEDIRVEYIPLVIDNFFEIDFDFDFLKFKKNDVTNNSKDKKWILDFLEFTPWLKTLLRSKLPSIKFKGRSIKTGLNQFWTETQLYSSSEHRILRARESVQI